MEKEPDTENVYFMDEYPEAAKRVWLRRLNAQRHLGIITIAHEGKLVDFPEPPEPDGAA